VFFDFEKTAPTASTSRNSTCEIPNAAEGKIPSMKVRIREKQNSRKRDIPRENR
jgi:hypothetical protein